MPRWLSYALVTCAALAAGCLVTDDSEFTSPARTPPFLNARNAVPDPRRLVVVDDDSPGPVDFTVNVRSEDQGAPLELRLVASWPSVDGTLARTIVPSGTFSSDDRTVSIRWDPRTPLRTALPSGCFPLTLVASHSFAFLSNVPVDPDDADYLVWWVVRRRRGEATPTLADCPSSQQAQFSSAGGAPP